MLSGNFPYPEKIISQNISPLDNLRNSNLTSSEKNLKKARWDTILNNHQDNPEVMWNKWKEIFLTIADNHSPLKTRRVRNKISPWLTPQIRKHIIERDCLKKQAIKSGAVEHWKQYKSHRNKANNMIKMAKSEYYKNQI